MALRPDRSDDTQRRLASTRENAPTLDQLITEGVASDQRIHAHEQTIHRSSKMVLIEWLDQAQRLWLATEVHGLRGSHFVAFAQKIGINRSRAYELLKFHLYRDAALTRCQEEETDAAGQGLPYRWPGWEMAFGWFKSKSSTNEMPGDREILAKRSVQLAKELQESKLREKVLTQQVARIKSSQQSIHHSSHSDEYHTPQALFDHYDHIFHFDIDAAATVKNAKCKKYFTKKEDGLEQDWQGAIWLNPPYSSIEKWTKKAYESAQMGALVVGLLPARTDTRWFRDYVSHAEIELLEGRIKFGGGAFSAPFPSMIVVWRKRSARTGSRLSVTLAKVPG